MSSKVLQGQSQHPHKSHCLFFVVSSQIDLVPIQLALRARMAENH